MRPNRPKISVDQGRNRIEFLIWFHLTSIAKLISGVQSSCGRCSTVSLVTSSSWHHVSDLQGFSAVWQEQSRLFASTRLAMNTKAERPTRTWPYACMGKGWWPGIMSVRRLGKRSPPICTIRQRTLLWDTDRDLLATARAAGHSGYMHSCGRSYFCLLNIIFGCVSTEISLRFSTRSFPNRIEYSVC